MQAGQTVGCCAPRTPPARWSGGGWPRGARRPHFRLFGISEFRVFAPGCRRAARPRLFGTSRKTGLRRRMPPHETPERKPAKGGANAPPAENPECRRSRGGVETPPRHSPGFSDIRSFGFSPRVGPLRSQPPCEVGCPLKPPPRKSGTDARRIRAARRPGVGGTRAPCRMIEERRRPDRINLSGATPSRCVLEPVGS